MQITDNMCVILHLITSNKLLRTFIISYAFSFTKPAISKYYIIIKGDYSVFIIFSITIMRIKYTLVTIIGNRDIEFRNFQLTLFPPNFSPFLE